MRKRCHDDTSFHYIETAAVQKKAILFTSLLRKYFSAKPSWTIHELFATRISPGKKSAFNINCTIAAAFVHRLSLFDGT